MLAIKKFILQNILPEFEGLKSLIYNSNNKKTSLSESQIFEAYS